MKAGSLFLTIALPITVLLTLFVIEKQKPDHESIYERKEQMRKAHVLARKGYYVEDNNGTIRGIAIIRRESGIRYLAEYYISEYGEVEINTRGLSRQEYDSLIIPMKQAAQLRAKRKGIEWEW